MSESKQHVVHIKQAPGNGGKLTAAQKRFNTLSKKIEAQKQLMTDWKSVVETVQSEVAGKFRPLRATVSEEQAKMVELLDEHYNTHKFTFAQQEKLEYLIADLCRELIQHHGRDDFKPLYEQYTGSDFDTEAEEEAAFENDMLKSMLEEALGVKINDDELDISDPEQVLLLMEEKMKAAEQEREASRPQRKKTARQQAKEALAKEEEAQASKSIQTIYRQLVAALHPDREQDPVERDRKTELMQQVTVAYEKKDLLKLLELQWSAEQIDQSKINSLTEERLKYFNKVLQDQLDQLKDETLMLEMQLKGMAGVGPDELLTPKRLLALLKEDIRGLKSEIARLQNDLRQFRDVKQLKRWLKDFEIPVSDFDFFQDIFAPSDYR